MSMRSGISFLMGTARKECRSILKSEQVSWIFPVDLATFVLPPEKHLRVECGLAGEPSFEMTAIRRKPTQASS